MAVFDLTPRTAPRSGAGLAHRLTARMTRWAETRRTLKTLTRLTDRELDDIGLCRGDLRDMSAGDLIR